MNQIDILKSRLQLMESLSIYVIEHKVKIWPARFDSCIAIFTKNCKLCFVFRHCECELDFYCPYLILLETIENKKTQTRNDIERLYWVDQHFLSFFHFTDFRSRLVQQCNPYNKLLPKYEFKNAGRSYRRGIHLSVFCC